MAVCLYGEARGEPVEGQIAVANVINNRVKDRRWGTTVHSVLGAWAQFSCLWPQLGGLNYQSCLDFAGVLERGDDVGEAQNLLIDQLLWICHGVLQGALIDNTYGATHYHADYVNPFWNKKPAVKVATYGRHLFYTHVR